MATVYDTGRRLSAETVATWMDAAARHVASPGGPILDLGSGTGRFSAALAARFGVPVVAAEPAEGMREHATRSTGVSWAAARAEALPFGDASFAVVWASQVIHHVEDLRGGARELRRVLRPGGTLLLRGVFAATAEGIPWARYFPGAVHTVTSVYPTLEHVTDVFAAAGLRRQSHEVVVQVTASSLGQLYERVRLRADSTLEMLADEEFELGLARMRADAQNETSPTPVREPVELVTFRLESSATVTAWLRPGWRAAGTAASTRPP